MSTLEISCRFSATTTSCITQMSCRSISTCGCWLLLTVKGNLGMCWSTTVGVVVEWTSTKTVSIRVSTLVTVRR